MKNITRREVAKALAIGTATVFVAPAALANSHPDANFLVLERRWQQIMEVELPPLLDAYDEAEQYVMSSAPFQPEPRKSLREIEKREREVLANLKGEGIKSDLARALMKENYPGLVFATAVTRHFARDHEVAEKYEAHIAAKERAEAESDYKGRSARMSEAYARADAIRDQIMSLTPESVIGLSVQLRMIKYLHVELQAEIPEAWTMAVSDRAAAMARG